MNGIEIPKRLFFIWFGNEVPDFVNFSIENHRRANGDFQIVFIQRTTRQLEYILLNNASEREYDDDIVQSWKILHDRNSVYSPYVSHQKGIYGNDLRAIQILGDILRVVLVNKYGGIYLDCDTFPMKPMEDLVCRSSFVVQRHYANGRTWFDNYFLGSNGVDLITDPINNHDYANGLVQTDVGWASKIDYVSNKINFFRCNGEKMIRNDRFYIQHYYRSSWRNVNSSTNMMETALDAKIRK